MGKNFALYIDELIKQKNFSDMTPKLEELMKKELEERLKNLFVDRIIDALSLEDAEMFIKLLKENKSNEEILQFVQTHVGNYGSFSENTYREFTHAYVNP